MKRWTLEGLRCTLLAAAVLMVCAACGPKESAAPAAGGQSPATGPMTAPQATAPAQSTEAKLVLVSPHNEFIRKEMERGFKAWYAQRHEGAAVELEWQDRGGTVEAVKYVKSTFSALGDKAAEGIGIDVFFGGGVPAFEELRKAECLEPAGADPAIAEAIPADLSGVSLRDPEGNWYGVVLSSFGIIYNKVGLKARGLPEPTTWADLSHPEYRGQLVLADPSKSGSARVCYEVILQKYGWEKGWGMLMEIGGNTREFTPSSSQVPNEVAQGSALAGMCIDFYGYNQIEQNGEDVVGYVSPQAATAVTPDPIAILHGARHKAIATEFVNFVLSEEGQRLWCLKPGTEGGPVEKGLWRSPVLPSIYEKYAGQMLMTFNPYGGEEAFNIDESISTKREPLIGPLFVAAFLSNSEGVKDAARLVQENPANTAMKELFESVPFSQEQSFELIAQYLGNTRQQITLDNEWNKLFKDRYAQIEQMAK